MFEENLKFNGSSFGVPSQRPLLKPMSDIASRRSLYAVSPEPRTAQTVPDVPELPDFLLRSGPVKASSLDQQRPWSVRKPFLLMFLVAFAIVGIAASLPLFLNNQYVQAAKYTFDKSSSGALPPALTAKPSAMAVSSYQVGSNLPKYLDISSIDVHARVYGTQFTAGGSLSKPINIYDTAWHTGSSKPGRQGAMIIGANDSSCVDPGVFHELNRVNLGSDVSVTNGAGIVFDYKVIKSRVYDKDSLTMGTLSDAPVHGRPGLNIVTCDGDGKSAKRLVVSAVLYQ